MNCVMTPNSKAQAWKVEIIFSCHCLVGREPGPHKIVRCLFTRFLTQSPTKVSPGIWQPGLSPEGRKEARVARTAPASSHSGIPVLHLASGIASRRPQDETGPSRDHLLRRDEDLEKARIHFARFGHVREILNGWAKAAYERRLSELREESKKPGN